MASKSGMPAIRRDTLAEILRILLEAQRDIVERLATAKIGSRAVLKRQQREIELAIGRFAAAVGRSILAGQQKSWVIGTDLGIGFGGRINDLALKALRELTTNRIKDVGVEAVNKINVEIGQAVIGNKPMHEVISEIQRILGGATRRRAMTIAYTSVGQAHSAAAFASMQAVEASGGKIAKRWLKSGKLHPRASHVHAHNQIKRIEEPFEIIDTRTGEIEFMRYPRDPKASAKNVINCGCIMVPVVDGSSYGASVIVIPDDPKEQVRLVPRAQYEAERQARKVRLNQRLATYLGMKPEETGLLNLKITHTGNAQPLLGDPED